MYALYSIDDLETMSPSLHTHDRLYGKIEPNDMTHHITLAPFKKNKNKNK